MEDNEFKGKDWGNMWLTTTDNPWNYYKDFDQWYRYDTACGYNTCEYVARLTGNIPNFLPDEDQIRIRNDAIEEILDYNWCGKYKRIFPEDYE